MRGSAGCEVEGQQGSGGRSGEHRASHVLSRERLRRSRGSDFYRGRLSRSHRGERANRDPARPRFTLWPASTATGTFRGGAIREHHRPSSRTFWTRAGVVAWFRQPQWNQQVTFLGQKRRINGVSELPAMQQRLDDTQSPRSARCKANLPVVTDSLYFPRCRVRVDDGHPLGRGDPNRGSLRCRLFETSRG